MSLVTLHIEDRVATVLLDRPDKRNAMNLDMFEALVARGGELRDTDVRAVVLAGNGDVFCAGLDLATFADVDAASIRRLLAPQPDSPANLFQRAAWVWRELPVPVVCALHGVAFGAGLQIALGADIRIAEPGTKLSIMEIRWGLVPDMGLSVTARGLVAPDVLGEFAYTGRVFEAGEGQRLGFLTRLDEAPRAAATRLAQEIAARSPDAVRGIKTLLGDAWRQAPADALATEARIQSGLIGRPPQREAVRANLENRAPRFE